MKNRIYKLICTFILVATLSACGSSKDQSEAITGTVQSIQKGKDGYTAELKTEKGEIYFATISIPNLGTEGGYRKVETGETITVSGEQWSTDTNEKHITVRKLNN